MKRSRIGPKTFEDALQRRIEKSKREAVKPVRANARLKTRPNPQMSAWSKKVKERDGYQCQWPGIKDYLKDAPADFKISIKLAMSPCATGDTRIDPHHIAERSLRPDLKYSTENGLSLCRTHHDWIPLNRAAAIAIGILSDETYEKARKEAA